MKNKRLFRFSCLALAGALLVGSTFAYFTDQKTVTSSGTAGTVAISVDNKINLLNAKGQDIINPGDMRDAGFDVTNEGNKSVDVRATIAVTAIGQDNNPLSFTGDAHTQSEYDLYAREDVEFVDGHGYQPLPGKEPLQIKSIKDNVITYFVPEYSLNGNLEKNPDGVETIKGVTDHKHTHDYVFVMKGSADNKWQNSTVLIDVLVEAKQHENTGAWQPVEIDHIQHGSINKDVVPAENVITNANRVTTVYTGGVDVLRPPLDAAQKEHGTALKNVSIISSTSIYEQLVNNNKYTDVSRDKNMDVVAGVIGDTFYIAAKDKTIIIAPKDVSNLFADLQHITKIEMNDMIFNETTNMNGMFQGSSNLQHVVFPNTDNVYPGPNGTTIRPDFSGVTDAGNIFNGCGSLQTGGDILNQLPNLENANGAFNGCGSLGVIDLSKHDYIDPNWLDWFVKNADRIDKIIISATAAQGLDKEMTADDKAALNGKFEIVGTLKPVEKTEGTYSQLVDGPTFNDRIKQIHQKNPYTKIKTVNDTAIYEQIKSANDYVDLSETGVSAFAGVIGDTCYIAVPSDKTMYAPVNASKMFCADQIPNGSSERLYSVTDIDVSTLNTSDTTNMSYMFQGGNTSDLKNLNVCNFDTSKVTDMSGMFYMCRKVESFNLSDFNTKNVTNMSNMFYYCDGAFNIYVSGLWNISNVTASNNMFSYCGRLYGPQGNPTGSHSDKTLANYIDGVLTFYDGKPNTLISGPELNYKMHYVFSIKPKEVKFGDYHTQIPQKNTFDLSSTRDDSVVGWMEGSVFYITTRDGSMINTTANMSRMFTEERYNIDLTHIVFDNINTSKAIGMTDMFKNCIRLKNIEFKTFDTSHVKYMQRMFLSCEDLTTVNLNAFDTSNVVDMSYMFYNCHHLFQIDISNFDTRNVVNTSKMFSCEAGMDGQVQTIYVSDLWDMSKVTNSKGMFDYCNKLTGQSKATLSTLNNVSDASVANYQTGLLTFKAYPAN